MKRFTTLFFSGSALLLLCGVSGFAQETAPVKPSSNAADFLIERDQIIVAGPEEGHLAPPPAGPGHAYTVNFISSEMSFDRNVVKGAPYAADAVTETIQTLGDGNRIVRKSAAKIYRDGQGRTRREQTLHALGPFATAGDSPQVIFINDPVGGVNYSLDPRGHTARKLTFAGIRERVRAPHPPAAAEDAGPNQVRRPVMIHGEGPETGIRVAASSFSKPAEEQLGRQNIEGVEAEGTRTTVTIPAGQIGNERPIEIVSERWYSPELQAVVMSKHSDPVAGETTYRLTNINRSEPARTLFEVPADYKVQEGPPPRVEIRSIRKPGEGQ